MTARPALHPHRDIQLVTRYEESDDHLVPVPAADVVEAVRVLRGALNHYGELDTNFLEGINSAYGPVLEALQTLLSRTYAWDQQTAHIPFAPLWHIVETLLDMTHWKRDGGVIAPGGYKEVADEIALAHRLALALDAYDLATYAIGDEGAAAAEEEAGEEAEPTPGNILRMLRHLVQQAGYDGFLQDVQGLEADGTIDTKMAAGLRTIAAHLQRKVAPEEETAAPEPPAEPPHAVDAFWSLAQYFQSKGVNVQQVAHDAVADMTPAP